MPEQETIERARKDKREGKSPSTQAGEFVKEEIHHIREGKHGARSTKQAIAIGLSKARRAGVRLKPPSSAPVKIRERAEQDYEKGQSHSAKPVSSRRSRSTSRALRREGKQAASRRALSRQARASSHRRGAAARSASASKAAKTRKH